MFPLNSWTPYSGTVVSLGPCSHVSSHPCCHTQDNVSAGRPRRSPSSHASGVLVIERSASGPLDYHTCWQITTELEHHPTVTYKVLFILLIVAHHRRRVVYVSITEYPAAEWTAQQVVDAFPWDEAPRFLWQDRDRIYSASCRQRVRNMGIKEVVIAPRSP